MIDEIKKSINSSLYERTKSPLYGTMILSWLVWNWRLVYYLFAVDKKTDVFTRLTEIQNKVTNNWTLFYGPIISTIVVLTIVQIIANYSYWLHIYFKTWRVNKRLMVEGKQLLSYEQSLHLRNEIRRKEEQYEKLIQEKELNIKQLQDINTSLQKKYPQSEVSSNVQEKLKTDFDRKLELILKQLEKNKLISSFKDAYKQVVNDEALDGSDSEIQEYVVLGLFKRNNQFSGNYYYFSATELGAAVYEKILFT